LDLEKKISTQKTKLKVEKKIEKKEKRKIKGSKTLQGYRP